MNQYLIYASKFKYSVFIYNEVCVLFMQWTPATNDTCSVVFDIFRECGTVFYRVRYGAVRAYI